MGITLGAGVVFGDGISIQIGEAGPPPTPTYSIAPDVTSVNEGGTVTYTVTTTNVTNGTTLYWSNSGSTEAADFSDNVNNGSFVVNSNTATIVRTLVSDLTTEGSETIILKIRTGSVSGQILATADTVTVSDTSTTPVPTYSIAPNVTSVNEGGTVTFTITTTNVPNGTTLYWVNVGTTQGTDFTGGVNTGSVTINSNTATIEKTLVEDLTTEGNETIIMELKTGGTSGPTVATSATVTVSDTSTTPEPTYSISPDFTLVDEGSQVTFTITTTNVPNGTTLYWTNSGSTTAADFVENNNSGSVTITAGTATIVRTLVNDVATEGNETIILRLRTVSTSGTIVATAATVTVSDTSLAPTYSITPDVSSINEGDTVTFTVTTTNVPNGTTLYWTNSGTTAAADFTDSVDEGSVVITGGAATIIRTLLEDLTTEGSETIVLELRTGSVSGTVVATSPEVVTVVDISQTPEPTYAISPNVAIVNEGGTVTFTVTTTNLANGTTLYWTNSGSTGAGDFSDSSNSGSVIINSGSGTITRTLIEDLTTEGNETVILQLRTDSTGGTVVATSSTVNVSDTSTTPVPTYSISPNNTTVNEGGTVTYTVTTTNVANGTILYWTNSGNTAAADFSDSANSGSVTINSGTGTISRTLLEDLATEGDESIILQLRTVSTSGTVVATAAQVNVVDTSLAPTYSIISNVSTVNEGGTVSYTVTTTNVANGTTLFWTNSGTTVAADFGDNANSGSVTINSNTGTISRTLAEDLLTEGTQTIILQLRTVSTSGTIVATADSVTVVDTSVSPPNPLNGTWTQRTSGTTQGFGTIVHGANIYVAGAANGTASRSTDNGLTWTNVSTTTSTETTQSAFGANLFVLSGVGTTSGHIRRSSDGSTWASISGVTGPTRALTFGGDRFLAVRDNGANTGSWQTWTSTDGTSWSTAGIVVAPLTGRLPRFAGFAAGVFFAGGTGGVFRRSTNNGASWSDSGLGNTASNSYQDFIFANGIYLVSRLINGANPTVQRSTDGLNWTGHGLGVITGTPTGFAFGDGLFMLTTSDGIWSSPTGETWTQFSGAPTGMNDIAYANGRFVAVGTTGRIFTLEY